MSLQILIPIWDTKHTFTWTSHMRHGFFLVQIKNLWASVFAKADDSSVLWSLCVKNTLTPPTQPTASAFPHPSQFHTPAPEHHEPAQGPLTPSLAYQLIIQMILNTSWNKALSCSSGVQNYSSPLASNKFGKKGMKTSSLGLKIIFWPSKCDICFQHYHIIILLSDRYPQKPVCHH